MSRSMRRRGFLIRLGLLAGGAAGVWWLRDNVLWRAPQPVFEGASATDWLPFVARALTPVIEVQVQGRTVRALVDSGAQYSVADRALIETLDDPAVFDLPLVAYGVGGQPQLGRGVSLDIGVGPIRLPGVRTAILSLGPLAEDEGLGTPLILGQDVLSALILEIDPGGRHLRFLPREGFQPAADLSPVPVARAGRALRSTITVEAATVEAVVDTGASSLLALSRQAATEAGLLDGRPVRRGVSLVLGGAIASQVVEARTVTFGDALFREVDVAIYGDVALPGFPDALIGMEAFRDQRLVMDLGGGRLWTAPAETA